MFALCESTKCLLGTVFVILGHLSIQMEVWSEFFTTWVEFYLYTSSGESFWLML